MMFWNRTEKVRSMIDQYFECCDRCFDVFQQAFDTYVATGLGPEFDSGVRETHDAESEADDLRREIELTLYGRALLPESRGDILGLLESFDRIPNTAESVLQTIQMQSLEVPRDLLEDFEELVGLNRKTYDRIRKAVETLLENPKTTLYATKEVEDRESASDRAEQRLIGRIFDRSMDIGTKLMLKELVFLIGRISDMAETTADRIGIVAIKRQI